MSGDAPSLTFPQAGVALIRLLRPEAANRIQRDDLATLTAHLDAIEAGGDIVALVLASSGRTFSASFDLRALTAPAHAAAEKRQENGFEALANRLATATPVTIAALQGPVVGGATDLALACDLRVGAPRASFTMPAAEIGVPLYASALHRFVAAFGGARAKRLVLTAATVPAAELLADGVLAEVVDDPEARALALAAEMAARPAAPLRAMKAVLTAAASGDGPTAADRARLDAAYDAAVIAERVAALRSKGGSEA
jgi:enoyl-CoA hydratase/carnithine racemase